MTRAQPAPTSSYWEHLYKNWACGTPTAVTAERAIKPHADSVTAITIDEDTFLSVGVDKAIVRTSLETGQVLSTVEDAHAFDINAMEVASRVDDQAELLAFHIV